MVTIPMITTSVRRKLDAFSTIWPSPSSAPVMNPGSEPPIVLGRMTARVEAPVHAGRPHVVMSWPLDIDGRKRTAAAALFSEHGERLGLAKALWIELR